MVSDVQARVVSDSRAVICVQSEVNWCGVVWCVTCVERKNDKENESGEHVCATGGHPGRSSRVGRATKGGREEATIYSLGGRKSGAGFFWVQPNEKYQNDAMMTWGK